ncbi:type II toxin-antitoxin system RelE/ParE family toxin [Roseibium sp.]|uniref:type II toxin-antitoxin system RelE/ParE family toxin n=1 Tax=Roseibium sp. TaxID=1936156 RepID=UPI003B529B1B
MQATYSLKISHSAAQDLASIYEYGFVTWGEDRADLYYNALSDQLRQICLNPFLYATVDDIRSGYRRCVFGAHCIYFRVSGTTVEIMAVIGRQAY